MNTETLLVEDVKLKGWDLLKSDPVSNHKGDYYLRNCIIKNDKEEFVSYLYNADVRTFFYGHYFKDVEDAYEYHERRY